MQERKTILHIEDNLDNRVLVRMAADFRELPCHRSSQCL